jgi:protein-tyrosine phosphatase
MPPSKKRATKKGTSTPKGPSEIATGVFVGGWNDAVEFDGTRFCVLDDEPKDMPPAVHVQIYDEEGDRANVQSLDRLAAAVGAAREKGDRVLVFCGHGVRRSPLAGAWFLRRTDGLTLDQAYERIRAVRPKVEHARDWVGNASELEKA